MADEPGLSGRVPSRVSVRIALACLAVLVIAAVLAPVLAPHDPMRQTLLARLRAPALPYLLGTDELGRDLASRILFGLRLSLGLAFISTIAAAGLGTLLGAFAGLRRGWIEVVILRLADVVLSIPTLVLAILALAVLGPGLTPLVAVLALARWPRYARVAAAQTRMLGQRDFIRAAEMAGAGPLRILFRHILPNAAGPLITLLAAEFGLMILFEAGLSFLGLGVQPPLPALGAILGAGRSYLDRAWWLTVLPGGVLFLLILSLNILSDALRRRLDPDGDRRVI